MDSDIEKRQAPRAKVKWSIIVETNRGAINTETLDISVNGAFIRCWKPLRSEEVLKISIHVPNLGRPLQVDAEVAWSSTSEPDYANTIQGMGVQFTHISSRDRNLISRAILGHP